MDAAERRAARDFWRVIDRHLEAENQATREGFFEHAELGPLLRQVGPDAEAATRELLRPAVLEGRWEPYWAYVRQQAAGFAVSGSNLFAWGLVVHDLRCRLLARIGEAYEDDPQRLLASTRVLHKWLDQAFGVFADAFVAVNQDLIEDQQRAIRALSTPVLQVRPGLLIMPIIGELDLQRAQQVRDQLVAGLRSSRARGVVIDVTGVPVIDPRVAAHLLATVEAARLMGAEVVVSGLSADLAKALVSLGLDVSGLRSVGDLESGIEMAERLLPLSSSESSR